MKAQQFKNRKENYNPKSWETAIKLLKAKPFPDDEVTRAVIDKKIDGTQGNETHEFQKSIHTLQTYELRREINGFEICWKYNFCPSCNKVFLKVGTLINDIENVVYRRFYVRGGEETQVKPSAYTGNGFFRGGDRE